MNDHIDFTPFLAEMDEDNKDLVTYLAGPYHQIHGFLWHEATLLTVILNQFHKRLKIEGDVAEIGLWYGKYFILLSLLCQKGEKALGIDSFVHAEDPLQQEMKFREFLAESVPQGNHITILNEDSQKLCPDDIDPQGKKSIRFFSVDGDHTAQGTLHDILLAAETICEGGVIALDDIYNPTCPGVTEAYFTFDQENNAHKLKPFAYIANKLLLAHESYASTYYELYSEWLEQHADLTFVAKTLEFHNNQKHLNIPTQLSNSDILIILAGLWQDN